MPPLVNLKPAIEAAGDFGNHSHVIGCKLNTIAGLSLLDFVTAKCTHKLEDRDGLYAVNLTKNWRLVVQIAGQNLLVHKIGTHDDLKDSGYYRH